MRASSDALYTQVRVVSDRHLVQRSNSASNNSNISVDTTLLTNPAEVLERKEVSEFYPSLPIDKCTNLTVSKRMKCAIVMLTLLVMFSFLFLFIYARPEGTIEKMENGEMEYSASIENLTKMANKYILKVAKEGSCKTPIAKLIPILPSPHRIYTPHCAILHRCSDDTGCCNSNKKVCRPKKTENVTLPVKVSEMMKNGKFSPSKPVLLTFVNHTECGCERIIR